MIQINLQIFFRMKTYFQRIFFLINLSLQKRKKILKILNIIDALLGLDHVNLDKYRIYLVIGVVIQIFHLILTSYVFSFNIFTFFVFSVCVWQLLLIVMSHKRRNQYLKLESTLVLLPRNYNDPNSLFTDVKLYLYILFIIILYVMKLSSITWGLVPFRLMYDALTAPNDLVQITEAIKAAVFLSYFVHGVRDINIKLDKVIYFIKTGAPAVDYDDEDETLNETQFGATLYISELGNFDNYLPGLLDVMYGRYKDIIQAFVSFYNYYYILLIGTITLAIIRSMVLVAYFLSNIAHAHLPEFFFGFFPPYVNCFLFIAVSIVTMLCPCLMFGELNHQVYEMSHKLHVLMAHSVGDVNLWKKINRLRRLVKEKPLEIVILRLAPMNTGTIFSIVVLLMQFGVSLAQIYNLKF